MKVRVMASMLALVGLFALGLLVPPSWARAALGIPSWLLIGAALADALTPLGLLNYCVLQWFGVRLVRVFANVLSDGQIVNAFVVPGGGISVGRSARIGRQIPIGWCWKRWVWPLTGWWGDYRYIGNTLRAFGKVRRRP